jgi:hypothetical protein
MFDAKERRRKPARGGTLWSGLTQPITRTEVILVLVGAAVYLAHRAGVV